jgi:hypothetical protein
MTQKFVKAIFIHVMAVQERYMQASFQVWHDEGMSIDNTHKLTKKIFVNTSGQSHVSPFTAAQTNLSKIGKIVASRFKNTKSHSEVKAIVAGIKASSEKQMHHLLTTLSLTILRAMASHMRKCGVRTLDVVWCGIV